MATIALNVPRARKDEAKTLGARWDRFRKTWYVKVGTDLSPFKALGFYDVAEPAAPQKNEGQSAVSKWVQLKKEAAIRNAGKTTSSPRTLGLTRAEFLSLTLDDVTDFDELEVFIETEEHGLFTATWAYDADKCLILDRVTIKPYDLTADDFCLAQGLPWGKACSYDLPAIIARGVEIVFENMIFSDETTSA